MTKEVAEKIADIIVFIAELSSVKESYEVDFRGGFDKKIDEKKKELIGLLIGGLK